MAGSFGRLRPSRGEGRDIQHARASERVPPAASDETERLLGAERSMVVARWVAVVFATLQVTIYDTLPYPEGIQAGGYILIAVLAAGNLAIQLASRKVSTPSAARWLAASGLAFDVAVASAFVWLYAFDAESSLFLLMFVLPAEGALKFTMPGALLTWGASTVLYAGREIWAAARYDHPLSIVSINFRMGVLLIVALIIGSMARNLARRTKELRGTIAELQSIEAWRSAVIDMLAHDIRSPVGGASSTMSLIRQRAGSIAPEQISDLAASAERQNARALRLADDLLDIARARQGHLQLVRTEVDIADSAEQIVAQLGPSAAEIRLEIPPNLRAQVDAARMEQILTNLISNAFKHGRPPVHVSATARPDQGVTLRVSDNGDGIPDEQRRELFSPFATGARADSVGLGLWVADTLATAHGGGILYESDAEGRPCFVVELAGSDAE